MERQECVCVCVCFPEKGSVVCLQGEHDNEEFNYRDPQ